MERLLPVEEAAVNERHRDTMPVLTSIPDGVESLAIMGEPLLTHRAVVRMGSAEREFDIEGETYRNHEKPTLGGEPTKTPSPRPRRRSA